MSSEKQPFYHQPIMVAEVNRFLEPSPGHTYLDATLGGGGHALSLLEKGARVVGLDQDVAALDYARERLGKFGEQFLAVQGNFREMEEILARWQIGSLQGVLMDLGVSSHQFDVAERGFSLQKEGPLDMRMNRESEWTAACIVNEWPVEQLEKLFRKLGEEPQARRIARGIGEARTHAPLATTTDLADLVAQIAPRRGRIHPATRVFQALRMEVNDELGALEAGLRAAERSLPIGGRLAVISFHSLEDRVVKQFFREGARAELDRPEWPAPRPNPAYRFRLLSRKAVKPSAEEIAANPRSRSAVLRAVEKIALTT